MGYSAPPHSVRQAVDDQKTTKFEPAFDRFDGSMRSGL
jgi:hypothetical protein